MMMDGRHLKDALAVRRLKIAHLKDHGDDLRQIDEADDQDQQKEKKFAGVQRFNDFFELFHIILRR